MYQLVSSWWPMAFDSISIVDYPKQMQMKQKNHIRRQSLAANANISNFIHTLQWILYNSTVLAIRPGRVVTCTTNDSSSGVPNFPSQNSRCIHKYITSLLWLLFVKKSCAVQNKFDWTAVSTVAAWLKLSILYVNGAHGISANCKWCNSLLLIFISKQRYPLLLLWLFTKYAIYGEWEHEEQAEQTRVSSWKIIKSGCVLCGSCSTGCSLIFLASSHSMVDFLPRQWTRNGITEQLHRPTQQ